MMFSKASCLALTLGLAAAMPQGLPAGVSDLPDCALNGLPSVLAASGCQGIDTDCLCSKPDLPAQLDSAVNDACPEQSDRDKIKAFIAGFCPSPTSSAPESTSMTSSEMMTTSAPITSEATTTETMTTSEEMSMTMTMSTTTIASASSMMPFTNGTNGTMSPTYNSPSPSDTAAPASTGAATSNFGSSLLAFAVAMGGMTWAFAEL